MTPWITTYQAPLSCTISWSLLKLMSISIIQPSHPLSPPSPFAFSISQHQGVFQRVSSSHRWPKYWSFNFSISISNKYSGLISFRIDFSDLLAVQNSPESSPAPQFESINSLVLSLLYGPTLTSVHDYWKNHLGNMCQIVDFLSFLLVSLGHWELESKSKST